MRHAVQKLHQHLITLGNGFANGLAVHIEIIEQARKVIFRITAGGTALNVMKYFLQRFIQIVVLIRTSQNIAEQLRGQDKEPLLLYQPLPCRLRVGIRHFRIVKVLIPSGVLTLIDIGGKVL